ncbi:MAG: hypothetical protein QM528_08145 [Phycisphaerales bacterium]|nr:hypothetical protein [Phycisphaerales bacterium]
MRKFACTIFILVFCHIFLYLSADAQCAICSKTAGQLGKQPAEGLNTGILYLMAVPLLVMLTIGFLWWRKEKNIR